MLKKFKITVDGKPYSVTVENVGDEPGHLYPQDGGVMDTVPVAPIPAAPVAAPAPAPKPAAPRTGGGADIICPMGGVVKEIKVSVGQAVNEGDQVAVVEAMKMLTSVFASTSGTVTAILVNVGDGVDSGQSIISLG